MTASIYLSIAALVVSVVTAWLNWRHTNKTFRQASDPELTIQARLQAPEGALWLNIVNLHSSVVVSDLVCTTFFRLRSETWRPEPQPWELLHEEALNPLAPLKNEMTVLSKHRLANVIAQSHPDFLRVEENRVVMLKQQAWEIRVQMAYRGALAGTKSIQATKQFTVEPVINDRSGPSVVEGWKTIAS